MITTAFQKFIIVGNQIVTFLIGDINSLERFFEVYIIHIFRQGILPFVCKNSLYLEFCIFYLLIHLSVNMFKRLDCYLFPHFFLDDLWLLFVRNSSSCFG
ncbi:hypothetical protein CW304_28905 [Bacillus sp. UFRGS-B20]|nr:hypothetical protein CW304_28905 [Bacillus sp. UFRGS-B20]